MKNHVKIFLFMTFYVKLLIGLKSLHITFDKKMNLLKFMMELDI